MDFQIRLDLSKSGQLLLVSILVFTFAELVLEQYRGQLFPQNIELKAMAWAIGFGFQKVQARPKPTPGQHFWLGLTWPVWLGLAWLGFWPEAKPSTSLLIPILLRGSFPMWA